MTPPLPLVGLDLVFAQFSTRPGKQKKANEVRVTSHYMTKYERARILGTRALQISCDSPSSLKPSLARC